MKRDEFDWIHEQQVNKLNFDTIKEVLNEFLKLDSRWEDKNFIDFSIFRRIFPLDCIYLYFKNTNMSFGNQVYDESLRFKTILLNCFKNFYLEKDFKFHYKVVYTDKFEFDDHVRNSIRERNKADLSLKYDAGEGFSLRDFVFVLLDNYYPRVGWRWIGAGHYVYHITLEIIVTLFELGYWSVADLKQLFFKLYEICEVLISLEKNSSRDSEKLSVTFNQDLIEGFKKAKEYVTLIIIHAYQLLVDSRADEETTSNFKFYFNLIITRYIFNSTKLKGKILRNKNNLKQIIYYLNSSNFQLPDKVNAICDAKAAKCRAAVRQIEGRFQQIIDRVRSREIDNRPETKTEIFGNLYENLKTVFSLFRRNEFDLLEMLTGKVLVLWVKVLDLLKDFYKEELNEISMLTLCFINKLVLKHNSLLDSFVFQNIMKDFFKIFPFSSLVMISKFLTEDDLTLNKKFVEHLFYIFKNLLDEVVEIFKNPQTAFSSSFEVCINLLEFFIKNFSVKSAAKFDTSQLDVKFNLVSIISHNFVSQLNDLLFSEKNKLIPQSKALELSFDDIAKMEGAEDRRAYLRTKLAYLLLKAYNVCLYNGFRADNIINDLDDALIEKILQFKLGRLKFELIRFMDQSIIFTYNNLVTKRLDHNKSENFILMENSFPFKMDRIEMIFDIFIRTLNSASMNKLDDDEKDEFVFEVCLPMIYKMLYGFIYLKDDDQNIDFTSKIQEFLQNFIDCVTEYDNFGFKNKQLFTRACREDRLDDDHQVYDFIYKNHSSYTNSVVVKKIFYNVLYVIRQLYRSKPDHECYIEEFVRCDRLEVSRPAVFQDNLKDILAKIEYISDIDDGESMTNMMIYFITGFERCSVDLKYNKFKENSDSFYLNTDFLDLINLLTTTFQNNDRFKKKFVELVQENKTQAKDYHRFLHKFWIFYRDNLFFSAYNFFHNKVWRYLSKWFIDLNAFLMVLTDTRSPEFPLHSDLFLSSPRLVSTPDQAQENQISKYLFDYNLICDYNYKHSIFFQLYVILECLGNYNNLLHMQNFLKIQNKSSIFFVIEKVFELLSNLLRHHPQAQEKIYVYRIDIWMKILTTNVDDLDSNYYHLKFQTLNYFLAMMSENNKKIIKFYADNINPEILKQSINYLFRRLLEKHDLKEALFVDIVSIRPKLRSEKIYALIHKMHDFYSYLIKYDIQSNFLHLFMTEKLKKVREDPTKQNLAFLESNNLLFFYYFDRQYTTITFDLLNQTYEFKTFRSKSLPAPVELGDLDKIEKGQLRLCDYIDRNKSRNVNIDMVNQKICFVKNLIHAKAPTSAIQTAIINKVQSNDRDWISSNILNDPPKRA